MILTEKTTILITSNKNHYISLGYDVKYGDKIEVPICDLTKSSIVQIEAKCDVCPSIKLLSYDKYNKNISKHGIYTCCTKCASIKNKMTNMERYGVEAPLQSSEILSKLENTNIERYGCKNVGQNKEIKDKIKETKSKSK